MEEQQDADRVLSRADAAAYLTTKGRSTKTSTLAKYATDGRGPTFTKAEGAKGATTYRLRDLDAWLVAGSTKPRTGGRPRKAHLADDDVTLFRMHVLPMIDRLVEGTATFQDGIDFADARALLQRLAKKWGNGL